MEVFCIASSKNNLLINEQIKVGQVLVIGPNGEQAGVKSVSDALTLASYAGLDLVLINPNQVGTLSETLDAVRTAQTNNYTCMITHVEGEIEDGTIADLAVGTNSGLIRSGSVIRNDSMEAYKRLMKIEEELKKDALFLGIKSFQNYKI